MTSSDTCPKIIVNSGLLNAKQNAAILPDSTTIISSSCLAALLHCSRFFCPRYCEQMTVPPAASAAKT